MKCPVCGSKMKFDACKYCKITSQQVLFASNKEAIKKIKEGNKEGVHMSQTKPFDVNRYKLILLTVFLGLFGASSFYVGRYKRGWFFTFTVLFALIATSINTISIANGWNNNFFALIFEVCIMLCTLIIFLWFYDIIKVLGGKFSIPVVLPDEKTIEERKKV